MHLPGHCLDHTVYACTDQHNDYSEIQTAAVSQVCMMRLNNNDHDVTMCQSCTDKQLFAYSQQRNYV